MSIARALAVLGAGATGYMQGQEVARKKKRDEENDAWQAKQRQRQETQWQRDDEKYQREQADIEAQRKAMAPPTPMAEAVRPETMDNIDVGQPGEQSFGIRVGNQTVPNQAGADAAVTAAMQPAARMGRAAAVTQDPVKAAQLQQQAGAAELGQIDLERARDQQDHDKWRRKAMKAVVGSQGSLAGPDSIANWMSESKADGEDGASKWAAKKDGANIIVYPVGPDGTALNQGLTIPDTPEGRLEFLATIDERTPLPEKLKDIRAKAEAQSKQADRAADNKRADRALSIQEAGAGNSRSLLEIQKSSFELTKKAAEAEAKIPPAVKMAYATNDQELKAIHGAMLKAQADNTFDPASPNAQSMLTRMRVLQRQSAELLSPYIGDGKAPKSGDKFGLREEGPAPAKPAARMGAAVTAPKAPAYGTPEYDQYVERLRLEQALANSRVPTAARQADFSRYNTPSR